MTSAKLSAAVFTFFLVSLVSYAGRSQTELAGQSRARQVSKPSAHFFTLQPASVEKGNRSGLEIAREASAWELQRTGRLSNQVFSPVSLHRSAEVLSGKTYIAGSPMEAQMGWSNEDENEMGWLSHKTGITSLNPASWQVASTRGGTAAPAQRDMSAGAVQEQLEWSRRLDLGWTLSSENSVATSWQRRFYPIPPSRSPRFLSLIDTYDRVPMIGTNQYLPNVDMGEAQLTEIPLEAKGLSFFVVVPKSREVFVALVEEGRIMSSQFWEVAFDELGQAPYENTKVILPKFAIQSGLELRAPQKIASAPASIQQVNFIEMNERGFHTSQRSNLDGIGDAAIPQEDQRQVIADRPFFFAIGSRSTGALLFVGQVVQP